ncbi:hypothetical protein Tco_0333605 [Tanacetum coccineum]
MLVLVEGVSDDDDMMMMMMMRWCVVVVSRWGAAGGGGGVKWRVATSGSGDRVDPLRRNLFGFDRKIPPEKFSGGGGRNPVGEGGRRWGGMRGERERVDEDVSGKTEKLSGMSFHIELL